MGNPTRLPIIAVLGATGQQGQGVVCAILSKPSPTFHVRAVTRNPQGPAAQALLDEYQKTGNFDIVTGDVYDEASLRGAFEGAHGVFGITANRIAGIKIDTEDQMKHELEAGRNIVDAAKHCSVKHLVFSSLPNLTAASNGRFTKVFHFDYKHEIENYAREKLPAVTALMPGMSSFGQGWVEGMTCLTLTRPFLYEHDVAAVLPKRRYVHLLPVVPVRTVANLFEATKSASARPYLERHSQTGRTPATTLASSPVVSHNTLLRYPYIPTDTHPRQNPSS